MSDQLRSLKDQQGIQPVPGPQASTDKLLHVVGSLSEELHPGRSRTQNIKLDTTLDRDLGFDSLARVELLYRLERAFNVQLSETLLSEAETLQDLFVSLRHAAPGERTKGREKKLLHSQQPAVSAPHEVQTLNEVLDWHVRTHPERPHILLSKGATEDTEITYRDLAEAARKVAQGLRAYGLGPGDRVAIMLPTGASFFQSFYGALYAGGVPVPIYPPFRRSQIEEHLRRQANILNNVQARILIAEHDARPFANLLSSQVSTVKRISTVEELSALDSGSSLPRAITSDATALIQYTSGSTGDPKGVVLNHTNLLSNIRAMGDRINATSSDVFVSWLPLYHDLGLIGAWLGSLYYAAPTVIMSPITFLARPERWLWAIHRHSGTLSAAPNFAFELCLHKIENEAIEGLDLSSLRFLANGAEPVSSDTIRRFTARFSKYGFRPEAMAPVYGLAENSVGLAFPLPDRPPNIDRIERSALSRRGTAVPAPAEDSNAIEFVSGGQALPGNEIRIVDSTGREVGERQEGRLQFRGPSATCGYFRNELKDRELFVEGWLDSGDLAYMARGDVFITGRTKDVIIRAGRNIYPQEVEEAVGNIDGVRKGCTAAFSSADSALATERLVILAETRETNTEKLAWLRRRISEVTLDILEAPPDEIILAPPRTVPKTSSGKIRRAAAREIYESKRIGSKPRALWWQITRLTLASVLPQLRRGARALVETLYAGYWWAMLVLLGSFAWPTILILPYPIWRWMFLHRLARLFLKSVAIPLTVQELEHLPDEAGMFVANHASYLDGLVIAASLPGEMAFVAKEELESQFFAGKFLKRLGTLFVVRGAGEDSVISADNAIAAARADQRLVFFAEGTFGRMPGLMSFHLGAFLVAAKSGRAVVPVAVEGTRSILRGDQWYPRHGTIRVTVGRPISPDGDDFAAAIRLRDKARAEILAHCGEPDLGQ